MFHNENCWRWGVGLDVLASRPNRANRIQTTVLGTGYIRDMRVQYSAGGKAVQICCPADLSGIPAGMTALYFSG
jgi:hypothetical protein